MDDFDVCSMDTELEEKFYSNNGPENETTYQMISRSYNGLCNRICSPTRLLYESSSLLSEEDQLHFSVEEFDLRLHIPHIYGGPHASEKEASLSVHGVLWLNKNPKTSQPKPSSLSSSSPSPSAGATHSETCVIYLHTNTRNLLDSREVLPLCAVSGMHLLAMDLPGHGKSKAEVIAESTTVEGVNAAIEYLIMHHCQSVDVILWARGMACAAALQFISCPQDAPVNRKSQSSLASSSSRSTSTSTSASASASTSASISSSISSQFTPPSTPSSPAVISVSSMSSSPSSGSSPSWGLSFSQSKTTYLSSSYSRRCLDRVRLLVLDTPFTSISDIVDEALQRLRSAGYFIPQLLIYLGSKLIRSTLTSRLGVDPYDIAPIKLTSTASKPCFVLAADSDDYISVRQCATVASRLPVVDGLEMYSAGHFGCREVPVVMSARAHISRRVPYLGDGEGCDIPTATSFLPSTSTDSSGAHVTASAIPQDVGSHSASSNLQETKQKFKKMFAKKKSKSSDALDSMRTDTSWLSSVEISIKTRIKSNGQLQGKGKGKGKGEECKTKGKGSVDRSSSVLAKVTTTDVSRLDAGGSECESALDGSDFFDSVVFEVPDVDDSYTSNHSHRPPPLPGVNSMAAGMRRVKSMSSFILKGR